MSSIAMSVADPFSKESRPIRILVADDHEVMRMGIRNLLESVPAWSVYAEAKTGREAVEMALLSSPDIIIMDIRSEEHTSELQSHLNLVCRLLLEKKKKQP